MLGWARPGQSKKFHVFSDSRALCGKWAFFGQLERIRPEDVNEHLQSTAQDCKDCFKRLLKHFGVKPRGG